MDGVERLAADCNSAMDKLEARVGETVDRCAIDASSIKLKLLSYVICISRPAVGLTVVALLWCVCTSHIHIFIYICYVDLFVRPYVQSQIGATDRDSDLPDDFS